MQILLKTRFKIAKSHICDPIYETVILISGDTVKKQVLLTG